MPATKIATCCYCGTRTALRLRGKERHELACASCGAPLHRLKMLPTAQDRVVAPVQTRAANPAKDRKPNSRRPARLGRKVFAKLWDELEDVFDDIFD